MDDILTEFVTRTHSDAALAHDLLEAAEWNLDRALDMYDGFLNTQAVQPEDQITPDMYATLSERETHYERKGEEEEEEEREASDTLKALEGSFETRRDILRSKRGGRTARGLSFLADDIVDRFHKVAVSKYRVSSQEQTVIEDQFFRHSFVYPDFSSLESELQEFVAADLIDVSLRISLENSNRLNWWTRTGKFPRLEPLATSGDGNCLLHAASLFMWGFHDRFLLLRSSMHRLLTESREQHGIQSRWRYQTQLRNDDAGGLTFSEEEWDFEWSEVVRIATNRPREQALTAGVQRKNSLRLSYEYLEEIHIFALAHVTQRPIIVIADTTLKGTSGEDLAPIYFGGVYLPLEMNPTACHKSPVVLAYDAAHFSALVAREEKPQPARAVLRPTKMLQGRAERSREEPVIPLVGPDGRLLPIQFVYDPKKPNVQEKWGKMKYNKAEYPAELISFLESYLNIRWVKLPVVPPSLPEGSSATEDYDHLSPSVETIRCPAAHLALESQPIYQKDLIDKYLTNVRERFEEEKQRCQRVAEERERRIQLEEEARLRQPVPCKGPGCEMFGTVSSGGLCSMCYQKSLGHEDSEEVEKVDLGLECRELDPETVEFYMPHIEEHLPSYEKVTGVSNGEQWDREGGGVVCDSDQRNPGEDGHQANLTNGLTNSRSWSAGPTQSRREPSPQALLPDASSGSGGHRSGDTLDYTSSSTSIHSTASESSKGEKSHKKSKGGWVKKKLQALPAGLRPGGKQKKPQSSGQTGDGIQPLSFSRTPSDPISSLATRMQCRNMGCEFFSDRSCDGYCSTCYKALKTITTTVV